MQKETNECNYISNEEPNYTQVAKNSNPELF